MYLMQALIFCAVVGSSIHWQWTPNQCLASGIGAGSAWIATHIGEIVEAATKMRPPGNAITATSSHAAFRGAAGAA